MYSYIKKWKAQYNDFKGFYDSVKSDIKKKQPLRFHIFLKDDKCALVFDVDFDPHATFRLEGDKASCLEHCMSIIATFLHHKYDVLCDAQVLILSACGKIRDKTGKET